MHRTALITGGTDGIGKAIARGLARAGHDLIIVGRDPDKGMRALHHLCLTTANENIEFLRADLSLMGEAKRLADIIADRWSVLNRLVHCAGIVCGRRILTKEGIESNFAVNYLSRFALTLPLLPLLSAGGNTNATARIVIVGGAAQIGAVHFDNFNLDGNFSTLRAVGQFSQANDIFAIELARRLSAAQKSPRITVTCLKIGVVKTNIRKEFPAWMKWVVPLLFDPLVGQTPEQAADAALQLLLSPKVEAVSGALFLKIRNFKQIKPRARVADPQIGAKLWSLSERLMPNGFVSTLDF